MCFGSAINFIVITAVTPFKGEELILGDDQRYATYGAVQSACLPTAEIAKFSRGVLSYPFLNHITILTSP